MFCNQHYEGSFVFLIVMKYDYFAYDWLRYVRIGGAWGPGIGLGTVEPVPVAAKKKICSKRCPDREQGHSDWYSRYFISRAFLYEI